MRRRSTGIRLVATHGVGACALIAALGAPWRAGRAQAQPCAGTEQFRVETVRDSAGVSGMFRELSAYLNNIYPASVAAAIGPPVATVVLIPASGTDTPARHARIDALNHLSFGAVAPGRYFVQVDLDRGGRLGVMGDVTVGAESLRLCFRLPSGNSSPVRPPRLTGTLSAVADVPLRDSVAVGDGIGRHLGSIEAGLWSDSAARVVSRGFLGPPESWVSAARRGFAVTTGDTVLPPPTSPQSPPWRTYRVGVLRFVAADTAVVHIVREHCYPGDWLGSRASSTTEPTLARQAGGAWRVVPAPGRITIGDGVCR